MECLGTKCITKGELKENLKEYISDADLKEYFGDNFETLKYSELKAYNNIEQLLPHDKSFQILLLEWGHNIGHWITLLRYNCDGEQVIEYFNSYGKGISFEIKELDHETRHELGQCTLHLNKLLTDALDHFTVLYNKIQFQSYNTGIGTCGRFCIMRIVMMLYFDLDIYKFIEFMKQMKKNTGLTYDEIVAIWID